MKKFFTLIACILSGSISMAQDKQPDMTGMELTAKQWNAQVTAGWNLGNSLESAPSGWDGNSKSLGWQSSYDTNGETAWGNPKTTKAMIDAVKAAGFNAIRIPVRWGCHIVNTNTMEISTAWLARVKEVVDYAIQNDMYVIINSHHDMWLEYQATYAMQTLNTTRLTNLWKQIANYFADYDGRLAFAGTNEVHLQDNWNQPKAENLEVQNSYNQTFINAVRSTGGKNYYRHLIVQTYACNGYYGLDGKLVVPTDVEGNGNSRMSIEFHYYNPYNYCSGNKGSGYYHYWGQYYTGTRPSGAAVAPDKEKVMTDFFDKCVNQWGKTGLGLVMGEWGISDRYTTTSDKTPIHNNMTYYCEYLITQARSRGISTFLWDNNVYGNGTEKYGIFDRRSNPVMNIKCPWITNGIKAGLEATADIENVEVSNEANPTIYDLVGNKVTEMQKGRIYLCGGKKIIAR